MSRTAIITDSTAYIPDAIIQSHPITVLPLTVNWDGKTYRDNIDIISDDFYKRLKTSKTLPSTSQVAPQTFVDAYRHLLDQDYSIIVLTISDALSGTYASARDALETFPGAPITLIDSRTTALALCLVVQSVAEAIHAGADYNEAAALARNNSSRVKIIFALDTLEFLHRGGRIGGGSRFLGTMLNFKPVLEMVDGKIEAIERVRTRAKSLNRLIEIAEERIAGKGPVRLGVLHAACEDDARDLLQRAAARIPSEHHLLTGISPVIGTHTGPGTIGLSWLPI